MELSTTKNRALATESLDVPPVLDIIQQGFITDPLPAFMSPVKKLLTAIESQENSHEVLSELVLSDPILTHRVLKLANSQMFAAFGQNICTVSSAIRLLGVDLLNLVIEDCPLHEESVTTNSAQGSAVKLEILKSLTMASLSRDLYKFKNQDDLGLEELKIVGFFQKFGAICVAYYLPQSWGLILEKVKAGSDLESASLKEIGLTLSDLGGILCAKEGLPVDKLNELLSQDPIAKSVLDASEQYTEVLYSTDASDAQKIEVLNAFSEVLGVDTNVITELTLNIRSSLVDSLGTEAVSVPTMVATSSNVYDCLSQTYLSLKLCSEKLSLSDFSMKVMESLHSSLKATRGCLFLINRKDQLYKGTFFKNIPLNSAKYLFFSSKLSDSSFALSAANGVTTFVDTSKEKVMPNWWSVHLGDAKFAVIIPLTLRGECIGFVYLDWIKKEVPFKMTSEIYTRIDAIRSLLHSKFLAITNSQKK